MQVLKSMAYSYLKDSIGSFKAAWRAGYKPNIIPTAADTQKARRIDCHDTIVRHSAYIDIIFVNPKPSKIPIIPPIKLNVTASNKN